MTLLPLPSANDADIVGNSHNFIQQPKGDSLQGMSGQDPLTLRLSRACYDWPIRWGSVWNKQRLQGAQNHNQKAY